MKFKKTMTLNCLECNYDQTVVYATWWKKTLLFLDIPLKEYCPNCDEITEHLEIEDLPDDWRE